MPAIYNDDDEWPSDETIEIVISVEVPRGVAAAELITAVAAALSDAEICEPYRGQPWAACLYIRAKSVLCGTLLA
jgi:hypothetical protein